MDIHRDVIIALRNYGGFRDTRAWSMVISEIMAMTDRESCTCCFRCWHQSSGGALEGHPRYLVVIVFVGALEGHPSSVLFVIVFVVAIRSL